MICISNSLIQNACESFHEYHFENGEQALMLSSLSWNPPDVKDRSCSPCHATKGDGILEAEAPAFITGFPSSLVQIRC